MERTWLCRKERADASILITSPCARDVEAVERLHRRGGLALGGAEGGEVVMADQRLRRVVHGLGVERMQHVPDAVALERERARARSTMR